MIGAFIAATSLPRLNHQSAGTCRLFTDRGPVLPCRRASPSTPWTTPTATAFPSVDSRQDPPRLRPLLPCCRRRRRGRPPDNDPSRKPFPQKRKKEREKQEKKRKEKKGACGMTSRGSKSIQPTPAHPTARISRSHFRQLLDGFERGLEMVEGLPEKKVPGGLQA